MHKPLRFLSFRKSLLVEGGAERFMVEVIDHLAKLGVDARGVALNGKPAADFFGGKYAHLDITRFSGDQYPKSALGRIWRSIWAVFKLRQAISEFKPDFICGQNTADAEVLFFATWGTKYHYSFFMPGTKFRFPEEDLKYTRRFRPVFHKIRETLPGHKVFIPEKRPRRGYIYHFVNELRAILQYEAVRKAEHLLVLTKQMGEESKMLFNRGYTLIKAGLPHDVFSYKQKQNMKENLGIAGKPMVLSIGRLNFRKRIDLTIRAFKELLTDFPEAHFIIGGKGEEKENLGKLIAALGLTGRVKLIGFVAEGELYDYFSSADVFINMDWVDFDLTILEALALNGKVVCSSEVEAEGALAKLEGIRLFRAYPEVQNVYQALKDALHSRAEFNEPMNKVLEEYTWESYARKLTEYIR